MTQAVFLQQFPHGLQAEIKVNLPCARLNDKLNWCRESKKRNTFDTASCEVEKMRECDDGRREGTASVINKMFFCISSIIKMKMIIYDDD